MSAPAKTMVIAGVVLLVATLVLVYQTGERTQEIDLGTGDIRVSTIVLWVPIHRNITNTAFSDFIRKSTVNSRPRNWQIESDRFIFRHEKREYRCSGASWICGQAVHVLELASLPDEKRQTLSVDFLSDLNAGNIQRLAQRVSDAWDEYSTVPDLATTQED